MRRVSCCVLTVLALTLCARDLFAATIKKKNGKVVEGTISGLIVQKGEVKKSTEDSKVTFAATYHITNGSEIGAINEEGVTRVSDKDGFAVVTEKGVPPDDNVALRGILDIQGMATFGSTETGGQFFPGMIPGMTMLGSTETGGQFFRMVGRSKELRGTNADTLLGEFRYDERGGKLIPALEVVTANGTVTVAVKDIVAFKKEAAPAQESPK